MVVEILKELQNSILRIILLCVVIVLFNTALCRSAFCTVSFRKLVFRLPVLSLSQDIKICVIMLCNFDM